MAIKHGVRFGIEATPPVFPLEPEDTRAIGFLAEANIHPIIPV
jgi:hypothetical protein